MDFSLPIAIAGLGNPGQKYTNTRHNIGFLSIDHFQQSQNLPEPTENTSFNAKISTTNFNSKKIFLIKPLTFMNNSGLAISKILNFYKIPIENLIAIIDDLDLPLGKIRLKPSGGPGTHNGMKSLVQHLGPNFPRLRLGIESRGEIAPKQQNTDSFVLSNFLPTEQTTLKHTLNTSSDILKTILSDNLETAMNRFN